MSFSSDISQLLDSIRIIKGKRLHHLFLEEGVGRCYWITCCLSRPKQQLGKVMKWCNAMLTHGWANTYPGVPQQCWSNAMHMCCLEVLRRQVGLHIHCAHATTHDAYALMVSPLQLCTRQCMLCRLVRHHIALACCSWFAHNVKLRTLQANIHLVDHRLDFHPSEICRLVRLQVDHVL